MRKLAIAALVAFATVGLADDWPTYMHDNDRSGRSAESLSLDLVPHWTVIATPPAPAWPLPAKQNFWANKFNLKARVIYDRAFHVVSANDSVYYGSSSTDEVVRLDLATGRVVWRVPVGGPVRLAPTIVQDRVLFGCDDGLVYCLRHQDGKLTWKHRLGPSARLIPGNERVISPWPVRTGVLVEGNNAYFAAGIFPTQGAFQAAVNLKTGKRLASGKLTISPQGYLSRKAGRLYIKTGRNPAGSYTTPLKKQGPTKKLVARPKGAFTMIGTPDQWVAGFENKVVVYSQAMKPLWSAPVEGAAYSLAISSGRLLVSTDRGRIYCFAHKRQPSAEIQLAARLQHATTQQAKRDANEILARLNASRGYCLLNQQDDGQLAVELVRRSQLQVVMMGKNEEETNQLRLRVQGAGASGRVTVHTVTKKARLPFTSYMFNLVIDARPQRFSRDELHRVTRPAGGVYATRQVNGWTFVRRSPLAGAGDWSHMYANPANTVCSSDALVRGKLQLQWFGRPGPRLMVDRHHRTIAPVAKNGRLFIPGNNLIIAVDAYNGTVLWNRPVPNFRRVGAYRDCSNLVAADDLVYAATGSQCLGLDAETGRVARRLKVPVGTGDWGFLAHDKGRVFGSETLTGAARSHHGKATIKQVYYDFGSVVVSRHLFSFDRLSDKKHWIYKPKNGAVLNPTITVGRKQVFFVESGDSKTLTKGRASIRTLVSQACDIVALDRETGDELWRRRLDLRKSQHNVYLCFANDRVIVVGSRNSDGTRQAHVVYDIHVLHAKDGEPVWNHSQHQNTRRGGSHGEQDHHPVVVGGTLICEPFAYDLTNGRPRKGFKWTRRHRRGCGNIAASAKSLFFRDHTLTMFDLDKNRASKVTTSTRAGCWINMIPAGGLLLVPEASSGCTCNFSVQTSLAFIPQK